MTRVLIIDDELGIVEALADVLGEEGYAVATARNGKEALERVDALMPELIIVDYMMPVMSGLQFIEALRRQKASAVPIVLMTAVKREQLPKGLAIQGLLQKPFSVDDLLGLVHKLLKKKA